MKLIPGLVYFVRLQGLSSEHRAMCARNDAGPNEYAWCVLRTPGGFVSGAVLYPVRMVDVLRRDEDHAEMLRYNLENEL